MWNTIEIVFVELLDHVVIGVVNGLLELIHRKETRSWSGLQHVSLGWRCFILDLGSIG